ncbi:DsbA family protein [Actinoplanes sp. GCM10030250]|uniref:DsbA family protein n=1 Tax=Actinoplanes sp. GCM10030250 TaxID=3273376 RepID=UPI003610F1C6
MEVIYYFDPGCPFTWRTSRWLLAVAPERGLTVRWSPFSLAILNGDGVPEQYRAMVAASSRALRLVAALKADGRQNQLAVYYTELGNRTHEAGAGMSDEIVDAAADAAGVEKAAVILDDPSWDESVRESHEAAMALAGPGIGSPVLQVEGVTRGLHGPIISEVPAIEESLAIWDATATLIRLDSFFELKRGRG